jgi:hypothetical protein
MRKITRKLSGSTPPKAGSMKTGKSGPIIQGLWIGPRLTRFEHNSIKSYLNHGYTYHLYTYYPVDNVPNGVIYKDAREILPESEIFYYNGSIAPFSDMFRYKLLYDKGGVWTDCDIICLGRFPDNKPYIFVTERTILKGAFSSCIKKPPYTCTLRKVLNSFIMAPKHSEIMHAMWRISIKARDKYLAAKKASVINHVNAKEFNKKTKKNVGLKSYHWKAGSKELESQVGKFGLNEYITEPEFAFPVNWWDFKYVFEPVNYIPPSRGWTHGTDMDSLISDPAKNGTYLITIHNGWIKNRGLDKDAKYSNESLFEKLNTMINQ